jgi:hypothetical protein
MEEKKSQAASSVHESKYDTESKSQTNALEIPEDFKCPISVTDELMKDPVVAADGHTYERAAIEEWFNNGHTNEPKIK